MGDDFHQSGDHAGHAAQSLSASWFADERLLLSEVKRSRTTSFALPAIAGYDNFKELKRGGQGVVFEATQRSTRRRVALKLLLDSAYYSTTGKRRFEREVDLVASLRHPGIVRVYDSGTTDDGRAYLVMEFIEGRPLDEFCPRPPHASAKDVRTTLEVFAKVCDAVQHAHAKGVIHRDLKPSNIRVDEQGQPHVLDFGLAFRSEARDQSQAVTLTTSGQFVGSLPWASPEQAKGAHDQVDIRSDVYALGAMLYQLLTGVFPCDVSGSLPDALRNICEVRPLPARRHQPQLDEQLEVILAKALEKDPAHRYQSVNELVDDIRHHLAGEPIAARRESAWRVVRRNAIRYRVAMVAGSVVVLALGTTALVVHQSAKAAQRERDAATQAKQRSDATVEFLSDILNAASPGAPNGGRDVKVLDVLDASASQIDARYASDPLTAAQLHQTMSLTFSKLEQFDKATTHLERAITLLEASPDAGPTSLRTLDAKAQLGGITAANQDYTAAIAILEPIVATLRTMSPPPHRSLVSALGDLGSSYRRTNQQDKAKAAYDEALTHITPELRDSLVHLQLRNKLALILDEMGKTQEAEREFREMIPLMESRLGPGNDETLTAKINYAYMLIFLDRPKDAVAQLEAALAASEASCGKAHLTTLFIMNNLAKAQQDAGNPDEAERIFREALRRYEVDRGNDEANMTAILNNLGSLLFDRGKKDEGIALTIRARDITLKTQGEQNFSAINSANNIGVMLEKVGKLDESAKYIDWIRAKLEDPAFVGIPQDHWYRDAFWVRVGNSLIARGKLDEAEPILRKAYDNLAAKRGPTSAEARNAAKSMAKLSDKLARPDEQATWNDKAKAPDPAPSPK